jgi:glycosyltransferase involved in cell wall biosynthesis
VIPTSFSIVIPTYRRSGMLRRTLPSYLASGADEILLVDDDSGPPHDAIVTELADRRGVRLVRLARHLGLPAARNEGARRARGEWVVFGEDDVWFPPRYASTLIAHAGLAGALAAAGRVPLVHPMLLDGPVERLEEAIRTAPPPPRAPDELLGLPWPVERLDNGDLLTPLLTATAAVHGSVFARVRFDPGFRGNAFREETDFFLMLRGAGYRTLHCEHAAAGHMKEHARAAPGGSWEMSRPRYAWQMAANNWRLVTKHRAVLEGIAAAAGRPGGPLRLQATFLRGLAAGARPVRVPPPPPAPG